MKQTKPGNQNEIGRCKSERAPGGASDNRAAQRFGRRDLRFGAKPSTNAHATPTKAPTSSLHYPLMIPLPLTRTASHMHTKQPELSKHHHSLQDPANEGFRHPRQRSRTKHAQEQAGISRRRCARVTNKRRIKMQILNGGLHHQRRRIIDGGVPAKRGPAIHSTSAHATRTRPTSWSQQYTAGPQERAPRPKTQQLSSPSPLVKHTDHCMPHTAQQTSTFRHLEQQHHSFQHNFIHTSN